MDLDAAKQRMAERDVAQAHEDDGDIAQQLANFTELAGMGRGYEKAMEHARNSQLPTH